MSPADKVLGGGDYGYKDAPKLLDAMDAALKAFGPVQPRNAKRQEPFPFRGVGVHPDGNVDLALYRCYLLLANPTGRICAIRCRLRKKNGRPSHRPNWLPAPNGRSRRTLPGSWSDRSASTRWAATCPAPRTPRSRN